MPLPFVRAALQLRSVAFQWKHSICCVAFNSNLLFTPVGGRAFLFRSYCDMASKRQGEFKRLPTFARPTNYIIHLRPDLANFVFDGEETVQLEITEETKVIKLYSKEIDIKRVTVVPEGHTTAIENVAVSYDEPWETATFELPSPIPVGKARVIIEFKGVLNDQMTGFYRSKFVGADGKDQYLATTQFEATFARKAFPCWDEPALKATFDVSLTVPEDKVALSNMPVVNEKTNGDGTKTVMFATSPVMSTYVLAFAAGDFEFIEGHTKDNVAVRVYTIPGKKDLGKFALEVAIQSLQTYSEYFDLAYPLPKSDVIAIPDFKMGAMENWGLITFREVAVLNDPKVTSARVRQRVAETVAHEYAHMWFGNLVTMEWWTDLWLNEGYATFMANWMVNKTYPELEMWKYFIQNDTIYAMNLDALQNSHPIEVPIKDPDEVDEIFDAISYYKAASIIRMLNYYLGEEVFRNGLRQYLKQFQYKNAITYDLWAALSKASGVDVASVMAGWTQKMGFPLVSVKRFERDGKTVIHLEQKRYLSDGSEDKSGSLWHVPITIVSQKSPNEPTVRFLLTEQSAEQVLPNIGADEWLMLNHDFTGFYRVKYDEDSLARLGKAIDKGELSAIDRINLISDVFALVRSGALPVSKYLSLLESFIGETEFAVWSDIADGIGTLRNVVQHTDLLPQFNAFARRLFAQIYAKIGFDPKDGESHSITMLRPAIIGQLGRSEDKDVIAEAHSRFEKYAAATNADEAAKSGLTPDIRNVVFGLIAQFEGQNGFDSIVKIYDATDSAEVRNNCLISVARSPDVSIQEQAIAFNDSDKVRAQDYYILFAGLTGSPSGQTTAWNYLKANCDALQKRFGGLTDSLFLHVLKLCTKPHCSDDVACDVEEFFSQFDAPALARPVHQCVETIRMNAALLKRNEADIRQFLAGK